MITKICLSEVRLRWDKNKALVVEILLLIEETAKLVLVRKGILFLCLFYLLQRTLINGNNHVGGKVLRVSFTFGEKEFLGGNGS